MDWQERAQTHPGIPVYTLGRMVLERRPVGNRVIAGYDDKN